MASKTVVEEKKFKKAKTNYHHRREIEEKENKNPPELLKTCSGGRLTRGSPRTPVPLPFYGGWVSLSGPTLVLVLVWP